MTTAAVHAAVTVTAHDLATLLFHDAPTAHRSRTSDNFPALVYVARGLDSADLIEGDSDAGYGVIGDMSGGVRTASAEEVEDSDGALVAMIDKGQLISELVTGGTLPAIADRLTGMAREGWWA